MQNRLSGIYRRLDEVAECSSRVSELIERRIVDYRKKVYSEKYRAWHFHKTEFTANELALLKIIRKLNRPHKSASWDEIVKESEELNLDDGWLAHLIESLIRRDAVMLVGGMRLRCHNGTNAILNWPKFNNQ